MLGTEGRALHTAAQCQCPRCPFTRIYLFMSGVGLLSLGERRRGDHSETHRSLFICVLLPLHFVIKLGDSMARCRPSLAFAALGDSELNLLRCSMAAGSTVQGRSNDQREVWRSKEGRTNRTDEGARLAGHSAGEDAHFESAMLNILPRIYSNSRRRYRRQLPLGLRGSVGMQLADHRMHCELQISSGWMCDTTHGPTTPL